MELYNFRFFFCWLGYQLVAFGGGIGRNGAQLVPAFNSFNLFMYICEKADSLLCLYGRVINFFYFRAMTSTKLHTAKNISFSSQLRNYSFTSHQLNIMRH